MGKIFRIPLKLNFTPNTLGCYGLIQDISCLLGPFFYGAKANAVLDCTLVVSKAPLHFRVSLALSRLAARADTWNRKCLRPTRFVLSDV